MKHQFSRRDFLARTALVGSGTWLAHAAVLNSLAADKWSPPISVFSKIYQELKLDFDQAAELTADAGLDGVDCPVRPGGEILPERAADDMPRYAEALRRHKADILLLTTAVLSPATPHTESILRTAKKLGVRYYRLGPVQVPRESAGAKQITEIRAGLKDLAAMNKDLGLTAVFQNHSPSAKSRFIGGDLKELHEIVKDFTPEQIGVAFDLGHALVVHGDDWPAHFERLKSHVKVAYVKDVKKGARFTPFGEGDFKTTGWFKQLKAMNCTAPFSLHIEFDWSNKGQDKTRAALLKALRHSVGVLKQWVAEA
ncbi:MAG: TIM barrel protein [Verrucomicrobia bacterium]|nr:TIM barrel protein [Verrucomicrobiota bacterium]